jgi:hypothetical protein
VADAVRVGLDRFVLDALGCEALEERVEPGDGEGDAARARARRVRLDEKPGALVDLPEPLVPDAMSGVGRRTARTNRRSWRDRLAPALMRLLGRWNWWLPQPAARALFVTPPKPALASAHRSDL